MNMAGGRAALALWLRPDGWLRLLGYFAASSIAVQGMGFFTGVLWTRAMSVEDYAVFSIALSMIAMTSVLADMGLLSAIGYFWRQTLGDEPTRARHLAAILSLRRALLVTAFVCLAVVMPVLLARRGLPLASATLVVALVLATTWAQFNGGLVATLLRLEGSIPLTLRAEVAGAGARLIGAALASMLRIGSATFGLVVMAIGASVTYTWMKVAGGGPQVQKDIDPGARRAVLSYLVPTIPTVLLYAFKDQIIAWIAWLSSGSAPVAELFALGRITVLLAICGGFAATIGVPLLAQVGSNRRFVQVVLAMSIGLGAVSTALIGVAVAAPSLLLWIIGKNYAHLHTELIWALAAASTTTLAIFLAQINRLRGWLRWEPISAVIQIALLAIVVSRSDLRTSLGSLQAHVILAAFNLVAIVVTTVSGVLGVPSVHINYRALKRSGPS